MVATLLGTLGALGIFLGRFRGKALLVRVLATPMVVPVIVTAVAIYFGFSLVGLNNTLTGARPRPYGAVACPTCCSPCSPRCRRSTATCSRPPRRCGAPPHVAFRRVVLPLIAPGVATGALFAFATSFDELVVAHLRVGPRPVHAAAADVSPGCANS